MSTGTWIRAEDVEQSWFDLEVDVLVPKDFWKKGRGKKTEHWLEDLHMALRREDWPPENIAAHYSYFEEPVRNPDEGEHDYQGHGLPAAAAFRVGIDGEWLVDHPRFFQEAVKLENGIEVQNRKYKLWISRITAHQGPLDGEFWENPNILIREKGAPKAFEGGPRDWYPGIE